MDSKWSCPGEVIVHGRTMLQRQTDATVRQINRLEYEPYGLTGDEIAIVEAG